MKTVEFTDVQNVEEFGDVQVEVELTPGQAVPAGQHVKSMPKPHGVVPASQPQRPRWLSRQATPRLQHWEPQGVVPAGQQHERCSNACEHVVFFGQQKLPQGTPPLGQVTAVAVPKGRTTAAATAPTAAMPTAFRAWRLVDVFDRRRVRRSNDSDLTVGGEGS
jgi:hypothetical protein